MCGRREMGLLVFMQMPDDLCGGAMTTQACRKGRHTPCEYLGTCPWQSARQVQRPWVGWEPRSSTLWASLVAQTVKNLLVVGDVGSIPGFGRSPGGGHGNPPHYSCLENPLDRGAWQVTVPGVAKSWTWYTKEKGKHTPIPKPVHEFSEQYYHKSQKVKSILVFINWWKSKQHGKRINNCIYTKDYDLAIKRNKVHATCYNMLHITT